MCSDDSHIRFRFADDAKADTRLSRYPTRDAFHLLILCHARVRETGLKKHLGATDRGVIPTESGG